MVFGLYIAVFHFFQKKNPIYFNFEGKMKSSTIFILDCCYLQAWHWIWLRVGGVHGLRGGVEGTGANVQSGLRDPSQASLWGAGSINLRAERVSELCQRKGQARGKTDYHAISRVDALLAAAMFLT